METGIRVLLLSVAALTSACSTLQSQDAAPDGAATTVPAQEPAPAVIQPQVERREVRQARIDAENWEIGLGGGAISVEDFEVSPSFGLSIAYHISEDFFAQAIAGRTNAGVSSYERLSGSAPLMADNERNFTYYSLGLGWNVLPGEVFFGGKRAYNSAIYLTAGAGSTRFAGDDHFTVSLGAGASVALRDWLAVHLDVRDHILETDILGTRKSTHNFETALSVSFFF